MEILNISFPSEYLSMGVKEKRCLSQPEISEYCFKKECTKHLQVYQTLVKVYQTFISVLNFYKYTKIFIREYQTPMRVYQTPIRAYQTLSKEKVLSICPCSTLSQCHF